MTFTRVFTYSSLYSLMWDIRNLSLSGRKIAAIKIYRAIAGEGLMESKLAVESLSDSRNVRLLTLNLLKGDDDAED